MVRRLRLPANASQAGLELVGSRPCLYGQGKIAHSILPEESWAYSPGTTYSHDAAKAMQLLDDAGFKDPDGDGPHMRFSTPIKLSISAGNSSQSQYSQIIQNQLKQIGVPIEIVPVEFGALTEQWAAIEQLLRLNAMKV